MDAPMRPATPSRSSVNRPPSGLTGGAMGGGGGVGGVPASRAGRPGSRGGLASRGGAGAGYGGVVTDVQVEQRPVTQQGMTGLKTGAQGPGRQIQDKRFFLDELRAKKSDLMRVLEELGTELEGHHAGQDQFASLRKKHEALTKSVRDLQGQLADYNLVLDNVATDAGPDVMLKQYNVLKDRNEMERKKIDAVFTEHRAMERRTNEAEEQIQIQNRQLEAKLSEMAPAKRREYQDLSGENAQLVEEIRRLEKSLHDESEAVVKAESELSGSGMKQKALTLQEQLRQLQEKKYELDAEERRMNQSPEEQREEMMRRIKADNAETERLEQECRDLASKIKRLEKEVDGLRASSGDAEEAAHTAAEKYEQLKRQEKEITTFIDNFDANRAEALQDISKREANVKRVLEKTAKGVTTNLPTKKRLAQMQEELTYKASQLDTAQSTHDRLHKELEVRRAELDKIGTLEDKIGVELESLNAKTTTLNADIERFGDSHLLKREAEETKVELEREKISLTARKDALVGLAKDRYQKFEAKKNQLQENDMHLTLEKGNQRLRTVEQEIFKVEEYIQSKERETDFRPMLNELEGMVDRLNEECKRMAML